MALRNKVREYRMKALMSQKDLAEKAGVNQATLSRIEKGRLSPTWKTVYRIADALGCKVEDIFLPEVFDNSRTTKGAPRSA